MAIQGIMLRLMLEHGSSRLDALACLAPSDVMVIRVLA
jgi:hypothetical protein